MLSVLAVRHLVDGGFDIRFTWRLLIGRKVMNERIYNATWGFAYLLKATVDQIAF
jgi:hypothetical protein